MPFFLLFHPGRFLFRRVLDHVVNLATMAASLSILDHDGCRPEMLRSNGGRYICDREGGIVCNPGWQNENELCSTPICDFGAAGMETLIGCEHGRCVYPDRCACEIGWKGRRCDQCVPLPGCVHGSCRDEPYQCVCDDPNKWTGSRCNTPVCDGGGCVKGICQAPGWCRCYDGWTGSRCDSCLDSSGCVHGSCNAATGIECECDAGWTGSNCDCPICSKGCNLEHGYCQAPGTCVCFVGWSGPTCQDCVTQPGCPANATCTQPGGCVCANDEIIDHPVCHIGDDPPVPQQSSGSSSNLLESESALSDVCKLLNNGGGAEVTMENSTSKSPDGTTIMELYPKTESLPDDDDNLTMASTLTPSSTPTGLWAEKFGDLKRPLPE